ncbi:uncharacterized protein CMC5_056440 [Chondromyces crocatus]|uniref:Uncharacterized protein n=1 Tax=Chondromyces crocatus TaxID=52 RepID=A0A0K1EKN8_CHOCO|nr:uncharacterized protein CMC5_056440 [Chondromyces crocatus]
MDAHGGHASAILPAHAALVGVDAVIHVVIDAHGGHASAILPAHAALVGANAVIHVVIDAHGGHASAILPAHAALVGVDAVIHVVIAAHGRHASAILPAHAALVGVDAVIHVDIDVHGGHASAILPAHAESDDDDAHAPRSRTPAWWQRRSMRRSLVGMRRGPCKRCIQRTGRPRDANGSPFPLRMRSGSWKSNRSGTGPAWKAVGTSRRGVGIETSDFRQPRGKPGSVRCRAWWRPRACFRTGRRAQPVSARMGSRSRPASSWTCSSSACMALNASARRRT